MTNSVLRAVVALALAAGAAPAAAQVPATGRIVGRILEEGTGAPVPGAQVGIAASGGPYATSAIDGRYMLLGVPAGATALVVRAIGFAPKTVSGVVVPAGGGVAVDVTLASQTMQVEGVTVTAEVARGSANAALEAQRQATTVVNAISAEQIARSPDSDAAQAVQRVSGVTVQDGRYVFVRGLGERYTTTSLNNARLPSPEPERRVVPLDLFPSNLIDGITTTKTFTPDQPGDFSGGQVNLQTRDFPLRRTFAMSTSAGINRDITWQNRLRAPSVGREWLADAGGVRALPGAVRAAGNLSGLNDAERGQLVAAFRNVWSPVTGNVPPGGSTSLSLGGEDPFLGHPIGYLASFSYTNGQEVRAGEQRSAAVGDGSGGAVPFNAYRGETVTNSVLWGGLVNFTARLGSHTKVMFNNTFTRSGDNTFTRVAGLNEEFSRSLDITRAGFVERAVRSHQLQGQHLLGARHQIEWGINAANVSRDEPDRSDLVYEATIDPVTGAVTPVAWDVQRRAAVRTFSFLDESSMDLSASWRLELGASGRTAVKVGGSRRAVNRDADSRAYQIEQQPGNGLTDPERQQAPEVIFAQHLGQLTINPDLAVGRYTASDAITAGFVQLEFPLGGHLRVIGGVRVEHWALDLTSATAFGGTVAGRRRNTDYLPALGLTWRAGPNAAVRFSASQTLSRPEYREVVPLATRDIVGGYDVYGNANLQRALIRNVDLRWEWYPTGGEIVSVGAFAKFFDKPIERVLIATVGATASGIENSRSARNLGLEFEIRRNLGWLTAGLLPFNVFANLTLMTSRIRLVDATTAAQRNVARPLTGQASYVVNTGIGYQHPRAEFSATLLYNVVGRRIFEVGTIALPDTYEEPRHLVDLAVRFPVLGTVSGKLDLKNILDAPYRVTQGAVTRLRYRSGRSLGFGLSWNP